MDTGLIVLRNLLNSHPSHDISGMIMEKIIDVHKEKMKIKDLFRKTPIALVNGDYVGLAWMKGEYEKHRHDADEFFLVLEGHLTMEVEGALHELDPGMGILIRKGEIHRSRSERMTLVVIFEPQGIGRELV